MNNNATSRSLTEWMSLVTECRQSGLSDAAWCERNGINPSTFYNAVTRLRRKACEIPEPVGKANTLDLTASHQDVVRIDIQEDLPLEIPREHGKIRQCHLASCSNFRSRDLNESKIQTTKTTNSSEKD